MNFFEHQDKARKKTFWLVLYFLLAIGFIIFTLDIVFLSALFFLEPDKYMSIPIDQYSFTRDGLAPFHRQEILTLAIEVAIVISPTIIFVIIIGSLWKMHQLRGGGISVAEMVNAKPISPQTKDLLEKRFVNIVEEMSIASGVAIPRLYVMEDDAINAFVAGNKPEDTVMVVTRGSLNQLSRDELQSVVGHEFSHILNSDMQISLRLMGILGGLLLIGQIGYFLLRIFGRSDSNRRSSSSDDRKGGGNIMLVILIIGLGLLILGYIGLFFGRLIKAAVSRQRELLADASSVQFTRNPQGLVFALRRILMSQKGTYLASKNVEDISHLCFCTPRWIMFQNLLATHPPLEERINELDPQGQYKGLPLSKLNDDADDNKKRTKKAEFTPSMMMGAAAVIAAGAGNVKISVKDVEKSIGNPTPDSVALAQEMLANIPSVLQDAAHSPEQVEFLFYAMIMSYHEDKVDDFTALLDKKITNENMQLVESLYENMCALPKTLHLALFDIGLLSFKHNTPEKRQAIYQNLVLLTAIDDKKLFQFTLLTVLGKVLDDKPNQTKVKYNDFSGVITEISQLLSVLLKAGAKNDNDEDADFAKYIKNFTDKPVQRPQISNAKPIQFPIVLNTLNQLAPICKEKLIHVLLECVADDGIVNLSEAELIRAIAASLECPIPPILATSE